MFGAGFILLGSLMAVESLAGGVWYRSTTRTLMFPLVLIILGCGMVAVTIVEPGARLAHFAMGAPLIAGGYAEARVRLGEMHRRYADGLLVPALLFASLETAFFHLSGSANAGVWAAHLGIVVAGIAIASLRSFQSLQPGSLFRSLLIDAAIIAVGMDLFADGMFQPKA
jgi:hypothetical protein